MAKLTTIAGTFSGTGQSGENHVQATGHLTLSFAGTATVKLQEYSAEGATWINTGDIFTETGTFNIIGRSRRMRLDCTAHTDNVIYELFAN